MDPIRSLLAIPNLTRDSRRSKGSWGVNTFLEKEGEEFHIVKRPGLSVSAAGTGTGQGVWNYNNLAYAINGDYLQRQTYSQTATCDPNVPSGMVQAGTSIYGGDGTNFLTSTNGLTYTAIRASVISPHLYRANDLVYGATWQYGFDMTDISFTDYLYRSNDNWATSTTVDLTAAGIVFNQGITLLAAPDQTTIYLFAYDQTPGVTYRYTSTDNGTTWTGKTVVSSLWTYGQTGAPLIPAYNCLYFAPAAAYFMMPFMRDSDADCYLLKSTNAFLTATDVTPVFAGKTVRGMGIANNKLCLAVFDPVTYSFKIYQSADAVNWYTSANEYVMTIANRHQPKFERIFAASSNRIVFYYE